LTLACWATVASAADGLLLAARPATRGEALAQAGRVRSGWTCPSAAILSMGGPAPAPVERRILALLRPRAVGEGERALVSRDGTPVLVAGRGVLARGAAAEVLTEIGPWLEQVRRALVDSLGLGAPGDLQVLLVDLGADLGSYVVPRDPAPSGLTIVLNVAQSGGVATLRRELLHQYAHAVAASIEGGVPPGWSEAFATWAVLAHDGPAAEAATVEAVSARAARLREGLLAAPDPTPGDALWLAFLDQAHGPAAVGVTLRELARGGPDVLSLDRALRRATGDGLAEAFREFHLWTVLVGPQTDGRHFDFARRMAAPRAASVVEALPALAVHTDPPVAGWGATQVRITPDAADGGLSVRFEGDFAVRWEADLLLIGRAGTLRRVAIPLSAEGAGEVTVPLESLGEAWLLVRRPAREDGTPRRYTYAVHHERDYPFEVGRLEAVATQAGPGGIAISWDTRFERDVIGFDVLRSRGGDTPDVVVTPVWIPAVGDASHSTSYTFLDPTAEPGTDYAYRIQGITSIGLTADSEPVTARRPPHPR